MKTIFDQSVRGELISRINNVAENSKPLWGKMNVCQMTTHCTIWNNWVLGKGDFMYRQEFLGKIFGSMALKSNTKDDKPIGRNMPAGNAFIVRDQACDLKNQKAIWLNQIDTYANFSNDKFIHDFFGKMTVEQIGIFAYKHNDHHLRQFNL